MPFLGSFTGSRSFGSGGAGGNIEDWITDNNFTLISGSGSTAVYEKVFSGSTQTTTNTIAQPNVSYTLSKASVPISAQVLLVAGGGGCGTIAGGGGAGGVLFHGSYTLSTISDIQITIGGGGAFNTSHGGGTATTAAMGSDSTFGTLECKGGGYGSVHSQMNGIPGGSGSGCPSSAANSYIGGTVLDPGNPGATHYGHRGGNKNEGGGANVGTGGGGAGGAGAASGGAGRVLLGRGVGGGGGGGSHYGWGYFPPSSGGTYGGGRGCQWHHNAGLQGTDNQGGGGGSGHHSPDNAGGRGGSGTCVVRVRADGQTI